MNKKTKEEVKQQPKESITSDKNVNTDIKETARRVEKVKIE